MDTLLDMSVVLTYLPFSWPPLYIRESRSFENKCKINRSC